LEDGLPLQAKDIGMITRRVLLAASAGLAALPAKAAERTGPFRACFFASGAEITPWIDAFTAEMAKLGYVIGNNWRFDKVNVGGDAKRIPEAVTEVLALHPDVILTTATPTLMALANQQAKSPVVFVIGSDPIKLGIVQSLAHPGGSFTGFFNNAADHLAKNLQLIRDLLPQARRVAFLVDSSFGPALVRRYREGMTFTSEQLGFEPKFFDVEASEELPSVFDRMGEFKADALFVNGGPFWGKNRLSIIALTRSHRLPAIHLWRLDPADGGLMSYGADVEAQMRGAAHHVDKIFHGAIAADLPVEQATRFKLVINLKTAREMGVEIPTLLLNAADEVIE
jgi:putative tryptophan/tyrosine transport system substrate-binding protein